MLIGVLCTIGRILACILAFAALLVVLLLYVRCGIGLKYVGSFEITFRAGFVKINLTRFLARRGKQNKPKLIKFTSTFGELSPASDGKKVKKKVGRRKSSLQGKVRTAEKKGVLELLRLFCELARDTSERFARYARLRVKRLYVTAGSPEAADTAVLFGHFNTAVSTLLSVCKRFHMLEVDEEKVGVYADFTATAPKIDAEAELSLCVWQLIALTASSYKQYLFRK